MNFEKLLEQEAQRAALQDYEEVTEKTKNYSYKFSKEFIQKMNKMIYEEKLFLILNACIVLANDDLREKVGTLIIHFFEDSIYIHNSEEQTESEKIFRQLHLTYIPAGYNLLYETENPITMYSAYYEGQNDNYIGFTQGLKENVDVHVTYDGTGSRKIQVNGKEIYVVKDKEITSFYYEDNGCIITLSSTEKELELIKILKNIK